MRLILHDLPPETALARLPADINMIFAVILALTDQLLSVVKGYGDIPAVRDCEKLLVAGGYEADVLAVRVISIFAHLASFLSFFICL